MLLEIHRQKYGVTPEKDWYEKIDGEWVRIQMPDWAKPKPKMKRLEKVVEMRMSPPKRKRKPKQVKIFRVLEKTVWDYEAEVLCRNGWQDYYPGTLRHNEDSAGLQVG